MPKYGKFVSDLPSAPGGPTSGDLIAIERAETPYSVDVDDLGGSGSGTELIGQSLLSGDITAPGGHISVGDGHEGSSALYLYGGESRVGPVNETWTITGTVEGLYLYGGDTLIQSRSVTISGATGTPSRLGAGNVHVFGGDLTTDVTSAGAERGGNIVFTAGTMSDTDDGTTATGGTFNLAAGSRASGGGQVNVSAGNNVSGQGGSVLLAGGTGSDAAHAGSVSLVSASTARVTAGFDSVLLQADKFGWNVAAVTQAAHIPDPTGGGVQDAEARTAIVALIDIVERFGFSSLV